MSLLTLSVVFIINFKQVLAGWVTLKKYEAYDINDMMTLGHDYVHLAILLICNTLKQKSIEHL